MKTKAFYLLLLSLILHCTANAQAICPPNAGSELVTNGSFEKGVNGQDGSYTSTLPNSGNYNGAVAVNQWGIVKNANNANPTYMTSTTAHNGINLMLIDVGNSNNTNLWQQTILAANLTPNTTYFFSCWLANVSNQVGAGPNNPPTVQLRINGAAVGADIDLPYSTSGPWIPYYVTWKSPAGAQSNVVIGLENVKKQSQGNDLALDDISFSSNCSNIPDISALQPRSQLPSQISLCTGAGSALLNTKLNNINKTFEWKNAVPSPLGVSTSSTTVNTAGTYYVCIDSAGIGCPITDTIVVTNNLSMTLPNLDLCSPSQYILDAGFSAPNGSVASITWSGPSGSSNKRNYTVTTAGLHSIAIVAAGGSGCNFNKSFNVTSSVPVAPTNLSYSECGGTVVPLAIGDGNPYLWSLNKSMLPLLASGISYNWSVPGGTINDQTVWVQNIPTASFLGIGSAASIPTNSWPDAGNPMPPLTFTTTKPVVLNSFDVNFHQDAPVQGGGSCAWSTSRPVSFNITGSATYSTTVSVPCNSGGSANYTVAALNWVLAPGTYTLSSSENLDFQFTGSIITNVGGAVTISAPTGNHYLFANMNFSQLTACDPIPLKIKALCCNPIADVPAIDVLASHLTDCDPTKINITSQTLTNGLDYKWQVSHDNGTTWKDSTATLVVSSGKAILSNISTNGWFRLQVAATGNLDQTCMKTSDSAIVVINPTPTKPVVTVSPNKTFCVGEAHTLTALSTLVGGGTITYKWSLDASGSNATVNGLTSLGAHSYKVHASNSGCSDSTTINTNVIPLETAKILDAGPFCNNENPFNLQLTGGSTTGGTWSGTNVGPVNGVFSPGALASNIYKIKYVSSNTVCAGKDSINITVNPKANFSISSVKNSYCKNGSIDTIEVNTTGGTFWTKNNKGITDAVKGYFDPKLDNLGADTIYYGSGGACGDTASLAIVVHDSTAVTFVLPDHDICDKTAAFALGVASLPGGSYSGPGVSAGTTFNPSTAGIGTHSILYTYSDGNACLSHVKDDITVHQLPVVSLALDTTTACFNRTNVALSGGSPIGGVYSGAGVTGNNYNPSSQSVGAKTITYTFTDNNSCVNSATATFTINSLPNLALHDTSVCGTYLIDAALNATIAKPATYAWDNGAPGAATTLLVLIDGNHSVKVTDKNKCVSTKTVVIDIKTPAIVSLGADTNICFTSKKTWTYTLPNNYKTITWSTGDTGKTATLLQVGDVIVAVTNTFDCPASDTIKVSEFCEPTELCFPNVFTPNGDGKNDDFRPCGKDPVQDKKIDDGNYKQYSDNILFMHFFIYDRWGIKMFEDNNPQIPVWNGTFGDRLASAGTYYWVVRYTDSSNATYEQTGYVTLLGN